MLRSSNLVVLAKFFVWQCAEWFGKHVCQRADRYTVTKAWDASQNHVAELLINLLKNHYLRNARTQGIGGGTGGPHGPGPPLFNYEFCLVGLSNTISIGSIVEVNCLMKKCRYFVNIICKVAGFRNCLAECTMHIAQSVTLLWLAYRVGVVEQCCQMV